jgi:hypothetical protein
MTGTKRRCERLLTTLRRTVTLVEAVALVAL